MTRRLQAILALIDEFLARGDDDSRDLWSIMAAMRGPDDGDAQKKYRTTVHLRRRAFPLTAKRQENGNERTTYIGADFVTYLPYLPLTADELLFAREGRSGGHFEHHVEDAAHALGLL